MMGFFSKVLNLKSQSQEFKSYQKNIIIHSSKVIKKYIVLHKKIIKLIMQLLLFMV